MSLPRFGAGERAERAGEPGMRRRRGRGAFPMDVARD